MEKSSVPISERLSRLEPKQWFNSPLAPPFAEDIETLPPLLRKLHQNLDPASRHYYSDPIPIFGWQIRGPRAVAAYRRVLLRDGAVPLLWFLYRNRPERFRCELLVHERFRELIPRQWKGRVRAYRKISFTPEPWAGDRTHLFLVSQFAAGQSGLAELKRQVDELASALAHGPKLAIRVALGVQAGLDGSVPRASELGEFCAYLERRLGRGIKFVEWQEVAETPGFRHAYVHELNDLSLCSDDYRTAHLLAKGAVHLVGGRPRSGLGPASVNALSPTHGLLISRKKIEGRAFSRKESDLFELMARPSLDSEIWDWRFAEFVRILASGRRSG